jgi:cell cycle checkpoint control protein RAD9A
VTKRHSLHLGTTEFLRADVDPDTTPSGFLVPARTLRTWLDHFHIGLTSSSISTSGGSTTIRQENQLSWMFARDEVRVKSWEGSTKELSTEIKVKKADFEDYDVFNGRVDLTLPMREFRVCRSAVGGLCCQADMKATLALADQLSIRLVVAFSEAGQPLTLTSDPNDADQDITPDIFCAIATTTCDQFLSVRNQSDQPQSNGRTDSGSGSRTSFLGRNNSRQRDFSDGGDVSNGNGEGGDRNVRPRLSSEQPSRRGRLSMSSQPSRVPNSVPTTTSRTSGGPSTSQQLNRDRGEDPLFIPTDTQYQLDDHDDDGHQNRNHGAPHLSQAEAEAIADLGDMDDILDGMDDLQHEEEVEEMRASQQAASQQRPSPPSARRQPLAERQLEDVNVSDPTTLAASANEEGNDDENAVNEKVEGDHEGDVTHQADFEVHVDEEVEVPGYEAGDMTTAPMEEADNTTGPVDEVLDDEEEEALPATQANDDERRVSHSSSTRSIS